MIKISGVAHVVLSVSEWKQCRSFYEALLPFLGLTCAFNGKDSIYYIGGYTALGVSSCDEQHAKDRFLQTGVGLHHVCFRACSREDVDKVHEFLRERDAAIIHPPEEGPWVPGYYSVLFEDPAGIRLEVSHLPGKGFFEQGARFNPAGDYH